MENFKAVEQCMRKQCDFCNRKAKCNREIENSEANAKKQSQNGY